MKLEKKSVYYNKGNLLSERFVDKQGKCQGEYKSYWPNGNLYRTGFLKDDNWHGKWVWYKEDGSLKRIEYYWEDEEVSKTDFVFRSKLNETN